MAKIYDKDELKNAFKKIKTEEWNDKKDHSSSDKVTSVVMWSIPGGILGFMVWLFVLFFGSSGDGAGAAYEAYSKLLYMIFGGIILVQLLEQAENNFIVIK